MLTTFFVMQVGLIMVVLILHTYMGVHIIRRGIIFCDLVLDQLAAFGVVLGIGMGIRYGAPLSYVMALGAVVIGCVLLATLRPGKRQVPQEGIIGILYGMALIASLMLADKMPDGGTYFSRTLIGSMLWVSWPLVGTTIGAYVALILFHYAFRDRMIKLTENPTKLRRRVWWDFMFFVSQGIITILIVPVAGVLLAYGFLMIPAAIGTLFSNRWIPAMVCGWLSGLAACLLGLAYSYRTDSPYGPSLLLAMGAFFVLALFARAVRGQPQADGTERAQT
jgi:zinc/manganese transport system permease protein